VFLSPLKRVSAQEAINIFIYIYICIPVLIVLE